MVFLEAIFYGRCLLSVMWIAVSHTKKTTLEQLVAIYTDQRKPFIQFGRPAPNSDFGDVTLNPASRTLDAE